MLGYYVLDLLGFIWNYVVYNVGRNIRVSIVLMIRLFMIEIVIEL